MKKQFKNIGFFLLTFTIGLISFTSCVNDVWNQHYTVDSKIASNKTLWETIKENPDLTKFAWAVRKSGYVNVLSSPQMLTVWAPSNSAIENIDTTVTHPDSLLIAKRYVENHISRYSVSASGNFDKRIVLLNKKITRFTQTGDDCLFAGIKVISKNNLSKNGILHVIENQYTFFTNIWEYLSVNSDLDSVRKYLYSFDKITFDPNRSIPGDVNEKGEIVYLDSVKYNSNIMFKLIGALNNEDSSYVAILPTNTAWNKSYVNISGYFKYYFNPALPNTKITADTLQRKYTTLSIVKDLVFSKTMQQPLNWPILFGEQLTDSLRSTSLNIFKQPSYLVAGLERKTASNGFYYLTDDLKYNHYESWNKENIVEAERSTNRLSFFANLSEGGYSGAKYKVSGNRFLIVTPSSTSAQPSVSFEVPNTLSGKLKADKTIEYGTSYNIYAVFMPPAIINKQAKPAKVKFDLSYKDASYKDVTTTYTLDANNKIFETSPDAITKMLVASNVVFPNCEFGLDLPTVRFKVYSIARSTESVAYTREILVDCIILEPVK